MEEVDWKAFIKSHPVFSSLARKEIEGILKVSMPRACPTGTEIVREGEHGDSLFLIGAGAVEVMLHWSDDQTIQLATLREGEFFGEMALFEDTRRSASVIAASDCSLLEIKGRDFLKLAQQHHEIEVNVIGKLTARLRDVNEHVIKVKLKSLDEKIGILNVRMESQQQAAEATLKATQTIFDQTNRRANEIIESADRRSHRLSQTFSVLGAFVTVVIAAFGVLGWDQISNLKELRVELETEMEETSEGFKEKFDEFERKKTEFDESLQEMGKLKKLVVETENDLALFKVARGELVSNIILPAFREALDERNIKGINTAAKLFESSVRLSPKRYGISRYLVEIAQHMGKQEESPSGDYQRLLQLVHDQATDESQRMQANYLLLANALINGRDGIAEGEQASTYDELYTKLHNAINAGKRLEGPAPQLVVSVMNKKGAPNYPDRTCRLIQLIHPTENAEFPGCKD